MSSRLASGVLLTTLVAACATQGAPHEPPVAAAPAVHAGHAARALPDPLPAEVQHGLQVTQVGLAAAGGLVDVRFKVLDGAKAKTLLGDAAHPPMLIAGDGAPVMPPHHALKGARYVTGQMFYILYPNVRGAVQPGATVAVAVGDVRLGPVQAQ
jgi:hypothetical protein